MPTDYDNAHINMSGITVTHDANTPDSVYMLTVASETTLSLSNGSLTIATDSTISGNLTMSGGTLALAAGLIVSGSTDWTAGTITGGGTLTTKGSLTLGDPGQYDVEVLDGATIDNQADATLALVSYNGYGLYLDDGAVFDNQQVRSFTFLTDARIYSNGYQAPKFENEGMLIKAGGTGTSPIDAMFDQSATGTTDVQSGTLAFDGGGIITATMTADAGAGLDFDGGTFTLDGSSTITGDGIVSFTGAAVDDAGTYTVTGNTVLTNGTLDFNGGQSFSIPTLAMTNGTLTGFYSLAVTGPTDWTGGTISGGGTLTTKGSLTLGDPGQYDVEVLDGATIDNQADATLALVSYNGYGLYLDDGAVFDNQQGASFTFLTDARIYSNGYQAPSFENEGMLIKAGGTGTSPIDAMFDQSATGTTDVQSGTLAFDGGGIITATMTADAGAGLDFDGGTFTLDGSSTITGDGIVSFTGATVDDAGTYTVTGNTVLTNGTLDFNGGQSFSIPTLAMTNGTLTGFYSLAVTGPTDWTGGTISGGGTLTTKGSLTLGDPGQYDVEVLDGATIDNQADATLALVSYNGYGLYLDDGAVFDNQQGASFTFLTNARIYSNGYQRRRSKTREC